VILSTSTPTPLSILFPCTTLFRSRLVVYRHALRNALIPVLTVAALQFAGLVAGAVIVESVFSRPGLGRLAVTAILSRDFPLAQGIVLVVASMYVFLNVGVDLVYGVLDPRIRYQ